jgi:hypothetical protein
MSSILYYSNHCEYSKKLLQGLSKTNISKDIHFICIDKRIREPSNGKIYIVLENGHKLLFPEKIEKVPALLMLNGNILYGDYIYNSLKKPQEVATQVATQNNMEPVPFAFGNSGFGIVSDQYSFLDMNSEELTAKGSGGMRQMHNYVAIGQMDSINTPAKDDIGSRNTGNMTIEQLQQQREQDLKRR